MKGAFLVFGAIASSIVLADPSASIGTVLQRYPWNGLVDVEYSIEGTGEIGHTYDFVMKVHANGSDYLLSPKGHLTQGVDGFVTNGCYKEVFNLTTLASNSVGKGRLSVNIADRGLTHPIDRNTGATFQPGDYMVWDISSHTLAEVTAITNPAVFNTTECKTTKMVFRKVPRGGCYLQGTTDDNGSNPGTLTIFSRDYWVGIFEVTEAQYALSVNGSSSSSILAKSAISWNTLRGTSEACNWPSRKEVDSTSVIAKMRSRLPEGWTLDLPTSEQAERNLRAGSRTRFFWGDSDNDASKYAWWEYEKTYNVGLLAPNAWGLYDACGNDWEWCLNWGSSERYYGIDPEGALTGTARCGSGCCGGWGKNPMASTVRDTVEPKYGYPQLGFRVILTPCN